MNSIFSFFFYISSLALSCHVIFLIYDPKHLAIHPIYLSKCTLSNGRRSIGSFFVPGNERSDAAVREAPIQGMLAGKQMSGAMGRREANSYRITNFF